MQTSEEIVKQIGEIEKLTEELDKPSETAPVDPKTETRRIEKPEVGTPPESVTGEATTAPSGEAADAPPAAPPSQLPIMPSTGQILEEVSASVDLILHGMHAKIASAGLHENDEQLGALSMVMGTLRKAKMQADSLLGNTGQ